MKKLLLFALLCGAFAGCGKNTNENNPSGNLRKVKRIHASDGSYTRDFTYDENRLTGAQTMYYISGKTLTVISALEYFGNEIKEYGGKEKAYFNTCHLDADGKISSYAVDPNKLSESGQPGSAPPTLADATVTFKYANGYPVSTEGIQGRFIEYVWENGNLKEADGYAFTYGGVVNVPCNLDMFRWVSGQAGVVTPANGGTLFTLVTGATGKSSKNLPNRVTKNGEHTYLEYETDADGYVLEFRTTDKTKNMQRHIITYE